jgi:hypothetical protein
MTATTVEKRVKIIEQIYKLTAMTGIDSGAFEGEITNATVLIQKLMDKYAILPEEILIEASKEAEAIAERKFNSNSGTIAFNGIQPWMWQLAWLIGKVTHTKHYTTCSIKGKGVNGKEKTGDVMSFFGAGDSGKIATMLYDQWVVVIMCMAAKAMTEWCHELVIKYPEQYADIARRGLKPANYQFKNIPHEEMPFVFKASWIIHCIKAMKQAAIEEEANRSKQTTSALAIYTGKVEEAYKHFSTGFYSVRSRGSNNFSPEGASRGAAVGKSLRIIPNVLSR